MPSLHRAILFPIMVPIGTTIPIERTPFATFALIALNVIGLAAMAIRPEQVLGFAALESLRDPHQLISYAFLHTDDLFGLVHFAVNMLFLWIFAAPLEGRIGPARLVLLYLLTAAAGGYAWLTFQAGIAGSLVGASAAVYGIMGAYILLYPFSSVRCFFTLLFLVVPIYLATPEVTALIFPIIYWLLIIIAAAIAPLIGLDIPIGEVAWSAHLVGLVLGAGMAAMFYGFHGFTPEAVESEGAAKIMEKKLGIELDRAGARRPEPVPAATPGAAGPVAAPLPRELQMLHESVLMGEQAEVLRLFKAIANRPELCLRPGPQLDLARLLERAGDRRLAAAAVERLLLCHPRSELVGLARFELGRLLVEIGEQPVKAAETLRSFLKGDPPLDLRRQTEALLARLQDRPARTAAPAASTALFGAPVAPAAAHAAGQSGERRFATAARAEPEPVEPTRVSAPVPPPKPAAAPGPEYAIDFSDIPTVVPQPPRASQHPAPKPAPAAAAPKEDSLFITGEDTGELFAPLRAPEEPPPKPPVKHEDTDAPIDLDLDGTPLPRKAGGEPFGVEPALAVPVDLSERDDERYRRVDTARHAGKLPESARPANWDVIEPVDHYEAVIDAGPTRRLGGKRQESTGATPDPAPSEDVFAGDITHFPMPGEPSETRAPFHALEIRPGRRFAAILTPGQPVEVPLICAAIGPTMGLSPEGTHHAILRRRGILGRGLSAQDAQDLADTLVRCGQSVSLVEDDERLEFAPPLGIIAWRDQGHYGQFSTTGEAITCRWSQAVCLGAGMVPPAPIAPPRAAIDLFFVNPRRHLRLWESAMIYPRESQAGVQDIAATQVPREQRFRSMAAELARLAPGAVHTRSLRTWIDGGSALPQAKFWSLIEYENFLTWHIMAYHLPRRTLAPGGSAGNHWGG